MLQLCPSGRAKCPQCLELLEKLEAEGILQLPHLKNNTRKGFNVNLPILDIKLEEIQGDTRSFEPIM